jgi:hypothetical protein
VKVLIQREQRIGLNLAKLTSQLLFYAIDGVEEIAPIHGQFAAAELPIRAQQEMKTEEAMLFFIQSSLRDQAEIGDILLVFSAPCSRALPAQGGFE